MSLTPNPAAVPDRDTLPLKKRDQRPGSPQQQRQQQCDAATFKAPYPYKSHSEFKTKHSSPFQPVPRRVPALYQPWMPTHTPSRSKSHVLSTFREHHGWAEWREFNPLHPGWDFSHHYQHHSHFPGTHGLHPSQPYHPSRFGPTSLVSGGLQRVGGGYGWEQLKTLRDRGLDADGQINGKSKGAYVRRRDRRVEYVPKGDKATPPLLSARLPPSPQEDLKMQHSLLHESSRVVKYPVSGHSFERVAPGDSSNRTYASMTEDAFKPRALTSSERVSSSSPNCLPWLLPHFVAGSLIELRDGQLRRVEHLQTEDFLLGSLACPDLRLSCCTVQSISSSSSSSSSSISRLLILLHDQRSQELVDVYVEYPFFVRGQGWSSCSPQRTARLCGLQCRQLSVGDVCLALTPVSTPKPPTSATLEPKNLPGKSVEERCELQVPPPQVPPEPQWSAGGTKKEVEAVRRRHYSAPELRGPGTNCM